MLTKDEYEFHKHLNDGDLDWCDRQYENVVPHCDFVDENFLGRRFAITFKQARVLLLLASGYTARQAAQQAGFHYNTITRWRRDNDAFRTAENYLRDAAIQGALASIECALPDVFQELVRMSLDAKSEETQLKALRTLVQVALPGRL